MVKIQSFKEEEEIINSFGDIKTIAMDREIIRKILTSEKGVHLLWTLLLLINKAVKAKQIKYSELSYFQEGLLADDIINLESLIPIYGDNPTRRLYPSEISIKLSDMRIIEDPISLSANYTHPMIISQLCAGYGNEDPFAKELISWVYNGTYGALPAAAQYRILSYIIEKGGYQVVPRLNCQISDPMPVSSIEYKKDSYMGFPGRI